MNDQNDDRTHTHVVLAKGTMVSHYRIVEKIGAGGMGEVYLAEDTKLNRKVALKFLPANMTQDSDLRSRFTREAQATAKLNHPNIVTIFEVSEHLGRPFFAMELVEGQSLSDLSKNSNLSIDRIIELAIQVCEGLQAAHDKEIVHRDIKPSNIVIDAYGRPKILDFGLAAIQGGEQLTKTGSTLGTVRYMSPEQVRGQEVDYRSDLFSLGAVLYELISGRTPFEKDNEGATLKSITQDNPEPLARYKADIPDELQRTVSKLLEKDPSMRYQTSGGVGSDLKRLTAPTQSSITPVHSNKKTSWLLAVGGLVIATVLITAWIKYWPGSKVEKPLAPIDERIMLAVLPFENLGADEDEYFADGITGEITAKVGMLEGLGVIARASILQYKGTTKRVAEIGAELDVDFILGGSIRWDKSGGIDKIRITPELIRVSDETNVWTNNIQKDISEIFEVQAEIATGIAEALDVALLAGGQEVLNYRPTENLDAYDYYLRAKNFWDLSHFLEAIELLDKAIKLDSNFALAFTLKSQAHSRFAFGQELGGSEHTKPARFAYNRAFQIQPDLAEAHMARGTYLNFIERDYTSALKEFELARQGNVDEASLLSGIAGVKIRQGKWDEAIALDQKYVKLDPQSNRGWFITLHANWLTHKYEETLEALERYWLSRSKYYAFKTQIQVSMGKDVEQIQESLSEWSHYATSGSYYVSKVEGSTMFALLRSWNQSIDIEAKISNVKAELLLHPDPNLYYYAGLLYQFRGDEESSYAYFDSALGIVNNRIDSAKSDTTGRFEIYELSHNVYDFLAMAYSQTNRHEQAIEHARLGMKYMPVEACHF